MIGGYVKEVHTMALSRKDKDSFITLGAITFALVLAFLLIASGVWL